MLTLRSSALPRIAIVCLLLLAFAWNAAPQAKNARPTPKTANPAARFTDVTRAAGIDFHLTCGTADKEFIMDSMCGGGAVFDFDNDGWMDIYLSDGSTLADLKSGKCHTGKLFRNNHDGTFSDVSAKAGLKRCGWGFGVAVGDYDNDGWEDFYVAYLDGGALFHNNHDGTFTDATHQSGATNEGSWGTSVAFGDYDNDGYLDLYIANYVDIDLANLPEFGKGPFCTYRGIAVSCGPRGLTGGRDRLYHNNGNGTFTDVTNKLNIDANSYYGLGVLWLDYDRDGCLDLFVADDSSPSLLYHNDCKGGFSEVGAETGVAYSADGREQAGMGIDSEDYDNDGWPDIFKANFSDDTNNLYHNDHNGEFTDMAGPTNIGPISIPFLAFGAKFFDFDNDGWKDLWISNGHVNPQVDAHSFGVSYAQRPFLFHNLQNGTFEEIGQGAGTALTRRYVGRGAAVADFWNTGHEDVLFSVLDGSAVLLRNDTPSTGHWIEIKTVGSPSNRDGFGARIDVTAGARTQSMLVRANSSFESASDPRTHFGLGGATKVDGIVVRWPSGKIDSLPGEPADQQIVIEEGHGIVARHPAEKPSHKPTRTVSRPAKSNSQNRTQSH
jgi:enediyne biosynthesis protein E4